MVMSWLVLYGLCILGLITAMSITFNEMKELKAVSIPTLFFLIYFYLVILAFYHELLFDKKRPEGSDDAEAGGKKKDSVLITLEENQPASHIGEGGENDTFTCLMNRTPAKPLAANNPFLADVIDGSTHGTPTFKASFLPQPDEVIDVEPRETTSPTKDSETNPEADPLLARVEVTEKVIHTRQSSSPVKEERERTRASRQLSSELAPSTSAIPRLSSSHSALVESFDTTFTPFKSKSEKADLPKIKIFLPKSSEEFENDDNDDSSSSSSSADEAEVFVKPSGAAGAASNDPESSSKKEITKETV